jgi:hypothetical protein
MICGADAYFGLHDGEEMLTIRAGSVTKHEGLAVRTFTYRGINRGSADALAQVLGTLSSRRALNDRDDFPV